MRERTSHVGRWAVALWGLAVAIGLCVLVFQQATKHTSQQNYNATDYRYYEAECLALTEDTVSTDRKSRHVGNDVDRTAAEPARVSLNHCDLAAQYRAAQAGESSSNYAWWGTVLTFIGVLLLWLTLIQTRAAVVQAKLATDVAQAAVEETRRIGEAQARAYIAIESAVSRYGGSDLIVDLTIRNCGATPAHHIRIRSEYIHIDGSHDTITTRVKPLGAGESDKVSVQWGEFIINEESQAARRAAGLVSKAPPGGVKISRFWGQIEFSDVFNATRVTRIIEFIYIGNGSGDLAPEYED